MTRIAARLTIWTAPLLVLLVLLMPLAARAQVAAGQGAALSALIGDALADREPAARHEIAITGTPALPPGVDLALVSVDYQPRTGAFSALVTAGGAAPVRVTGRAEALVEVPALARTIAAGERIGADDIVWIEQRANRLASDAVMDPAEIEGQEAKRTLRPGVALRRYDVKIPSVIRKNELITVFYSRPGITLAARGRALEDATQGAAMRVLNLQSNRVIEAVADAPGRARVDTPRAYASVSQGILQ
jgi:flagella basal body P-ring formation protein FlgA